MALSFTTSLQFANLYHNHLSHSPQQTPCLLQRQTPNFKLHQGFMVLPRSRFSQSFNFCTPSVSYSLSSQSSSELSLGGHILSGRDPQLERSPSLASPPQPPPPGREDEFADSNGDSLQQDQTEGKVATLERDPSFDTVLQELTAIQQDGPRNVAILGTRHASYLHQQIIELLTYANVLVGNHVFTSGAGGTNAAVIRGALRAERPDLLTVVLPQSLRKQPAETQDQLRKVRNLIEMKKNDSLPLDIASQLCNSDILSRCTHFIAFAFHDSDVLYVSSFNPVYLFLFCFVQ